MVSIGGVTNVTEGARPDRLTTSRLVLRRLVPADAGQVVALHADPDAVRFRPEGVDPPERSRQLFAAWLDHWAEFGFGYWALEVAETGELAGFGGLQLAHDEDAYLNVFYRLFPRHWGNGYATEMVTAAAEWGRRELPALPIMIITPVVNEPARRVAVKSGFAEVRQAWFQGARSCFFRLVG
jgi:RimJ/RimL family protein N-acetyltransferase